MELSNLTIGQASNSRLTTIVRDNNSLGVSYTLSEVPLLPTLNLVAGTGRVQGPLLCIAAGALHKNRDGPLQSQDGLRQAQSKTVQCELNEVPFQSSRTLHLLSKTVHYGSRWLFRLKPHALPHALRHERRRSRVRIGKSRLCGPLIRRSKRRSTEFARLRCGKGSTRSRAMLRPSDAQASHS